MGIAEPRRRHQERIEPIASLPAAQIVPAVPTFSVDGGFWYSIPEHLVDDIEIGRIVRVPLGGRRVRGYVVDVAKAQPGKLKAILGVSGEAPVFDHPLLKSLRWAAHHYVAPLSVVLDKSAPPTLPAEVPEPVEQPAAPQLGGTLESLVRSVVEGRRRPTVAYVAHSVDTSWSTVVQPIVASGKSVMAIVSTVKEAKLLTASLSEHTNVVYVPDGTGSRVTRAWEQAQSGACVIVGTPRIAYWSSPDLGLAVVVEESRRAMKDRQTPTVHVRDFMRTRSRTEGFSLLFIGPTPSVELVAAGAEIVQDGRPWGLVEVVDRRDDPPGSGYLSDRTLQALTACVREGQKAFVFTHRRGTDASVRCLNCRRLRLCDVCGSQVGRRSECRRCGNPVAECVQCGGEEFESLGSVPKQLIDTISRRVGRENVGDVESGSAVVVGTERDLASLHDFHLAVAVDPDALLYGHNYRASEEALRVLARVLGTVRRGQGFRTILQTSAPESNLIAALRRGQPVPYIEGVLSDRVRDGFPPATEMMAVEARSAEPAPVTKALHDLAPGMVLGPVETSQGHRWLLQGDLAPIKAPARSAFQKLRDSGVTLRVDVDPIDL